jgi:hypothetical protein
VSKIILSFLYIFSFVGCATTGGYEKILQTWVGSSEDSLISKWGAPSGVFNMSNGKVLTYMSASTTQYSTTYNQFTNTLNTTGYQYWCKTSFTVNMAGIISNWRWEGNSCRAKAPSDVDQVITQKNIDMQEKQSSIKAKMQEFEDKIKAICENKDYAAIFAKTPCSAKDVTFVQSADESKINKNQKKVFLKYRTEVDAVNKERNEYINANKTSELDAQWVNYLEATQPTIEAYNLDLYKGKITWGEYNKDRKDITAKMQSERSLIFGNK